MFVLNVLRSQDFPSLFLSFRYFSPFLLCLGKVWVTYSTPWSVPKSVVRTDRLLVVEVESLLANTSAVV